MHIAFLNNNKYAAINAAKAIIAVSIALGIGNYAGNYFGVKEMYLWMVITVLVVMSTQPNLGGALDKAVMRFIGTMIGAVVSVFLIFFFDQYLQVILVMPFIAYAIYIAGSSSKFSYAGTLSGITMNIIVFNQNSSIYLAGNRALEISLGIGIALIVNRFVFPIRAGTRLKQSYAKSIDHIRDFFEVLFIDRAEKHVKIQESLFHEFSKHLSLLKELKYEQSTKNVKEFEKMGLYIRRLYRYMIVMYEYMEVSVTDVNNHIDGDEEVFDTFKKHIVDSLTCIGEDIKKGRRISYQEISCFKKNILPLLDSLDSSFLKSDAFIFYTKMFFLSLEKLAIEYNYLLHISKD